MKKLLSLLITVHFAFQLPAQVYWTDLNSPVDARYYAVQHDGAEMYGSNGLCGYSFAKFYRKSGSGTWNPVTTTGLPSGSVYGVWALQSNTLILHYYLSSGKFYRSTNNGATWTAVDSAIVGANYTCVQDISGNAYLYNFALGSLVYKSTNDGQNWAAANGTDQMRALAVSGNTLYGISSTASGWPVYKSTDGGVTWVVTPSTGYPVSGMSAPIRVSATPDGTVYIQNNSGGDPIYKSVDGGSTWSALSPYTGGSYFTDKGNNLFWNFDPNNLYRSTDAGSTYTDVVSGLNLSPTVSSQYIICTNDANVYVSTTGGGTYKFYKYGTGSGMDETLEDQQLLVYPNPANKHFRINSKTPISKVEIISIDGKVYSLQNRMMNSEWSVETDHLGSGLYTVQIWSTDGNVRSTKVIIQR